jgi:hypothetical protein
MSVQSVGGEGRVGEYNRGIAREAVCRSTENGKREDQKDTRPKEQPGVQVSELSSAPLLCRLQCRPHHGEVEDDEDRNRAAGGRSKKVEGISM